MARYKEMVRHVLSELSFVDFDSEKIKVLLRAAIRKQGGFLTRSKGNVY